MTETLQLITHTDTKAVLLTPELEAALPTASHAVAFADDRFAKDNRVYLDRLERSQFTMKTSRGTDVAGSLLVNNGRQSDELLVMFAPFADRNPKSSADTMGDYVLQHPGVGKTKAKPNSWSQTIKSAVTADVLQALGHSMPVLTVYAPVPTYSYSAAERAALRHGDFAPAARLASEVIRGAIRHAQSVVHGQRSVRQFNRLHLSGASLGASNAIGAAAELTKREFTIKSVTAQELVMSPRNLLDLAKRFTIGGLVGEASTVPFPEGAQQIGEAALRQAIDRNGSEPIGMNLRMLQGASKLTYMRGLTHPRPTISAIENLLDSNVNVLVATADNSAMSDQTRTLLPVETPQVHIAAQEGAKLGHIVDEHVTLAALVIALNISRRR